MFDSIYVICSHRRTYDLNYVQECDHAKFSDSYKKVFNYLITLGDVERLQIFFNAQKDNIDSVFVCVTLLVGGIYAFDILHNIIDINCFIPDMFKCLLIKSKHSLITDLLEYCVEKGLDVDPETLLLYDDYDLLSYVYGTNQLVFNNKTYEFKPYWEDLFLYYFHENPIVITKVACVEGSKYMEIYFTSDLECCEIALTSLPQRVNDMIRGKIDITEDLHRYTLCRILYALHAKNNNFRYTVNYCLNYINNNFPIGTLEQLKTLLSEYDNDESNTWTKLLEETIARFSFIRSPSYYRMLIFNAIEPFLDRLIDQ